MTWLLPSALGIAAAAAVVVFALHFIARSRPLAEPLPTARFVPERPIHARARSIALSDVLLLLMRVAAVLVIGLAVAGPIFTRRGVVARIVLADHSRAVANIGELRDSVRAQARESDIVIPFDSSALPASGRAVDSIVGSSARGSVSAALAAGIRAAAVLPAPADSVQLVLVSPLAAEELDEATDSLRAMWPGRLQLVSVRATPNDKAPVRVEVSAPPNDAVAAGLSLMGVIAPNAPVRIVRGRMAVADSLWGREGGHVIVHWPAADTSVDWNTRPSIDAIGGVVSNTGTLIARFPRLWLLDGTAVARWTDGEAAAVERVTGDGCHRDVGILIDEASDVTLRAPFRQFVAALLAPCGGTHSTEPASSASVASIVGRGPLALAGALRERDAESSRWTAWLLAVGALLLIAELAVRRSQSRVA